MKRAMALVLPIILATGIIALTLRRVHADQGLRQLYGTVLYAAMAGLYLLWMLAETRISTSDAVEKGLSSDRWTRELYAFGQAATVFSALWYDPAWPDPGLHHVIGMSLFLGGIGFRLRAVSSLGRHYSHIVRRVEGHRVIDSGPYRFVRHPAYAGMIAAHLGVVVYYSSAPALCFLVLALVPSIILRIRVEERMLLEIDGYDAYAAGRKRLVPGVW